MRERYGTPTRSPFADYVETEVLASSGEDETAGSVDYRGHAARIGRRIAFTSEVGHFSVVRYGTEEEARQAFATLADELEPTDDQEEADYWGEAYPPAHETDGPHYDRERPQS